MGYCSVVGCKAGNVTCKHLSFFSFPNDPKRRAEWERKCGKPGLINFETARVCSRHFQTEDFTETSLRKRAFGIARNLYLKDDAVPTENLDQLLSVTELLRDDDDDDDPLERRESNKKKREERQNKRERKDIVNQLLAEYEQKQQAAQANPDAGPEPDPIDLLQIQVGLKPTSRPVLIRRAPPGPAPHHSAISQEPVIEFAPFPGTEADQTATTADADRPPSDDDYGAAGAAGDDSDGATGASLPCFPTSATGSATGPAIRPTAATGSASGPAAGPTFRRIAAAGSAQTMPAQAPPRNVMKIIPFKTTTTVHSLNRPVQRRRSAMVVRAKELLHLKMKVRRLEATCLRVLGGSADPLPGTEKKPGDEPATGDEKRSAEGDPASQESEERGEVPREVTTATLSAPSEEPLVILRNERTAQLPAVMKHLRANQLSDSQTMFMPSDFEEAQQVNHQLKIQILNLEAAMLKWAIRSRTGAKMKHAPEEEATAVRGSRLRGLLRLESAVKAMFTPAQLRHILRNHEEATTDPAADKPTKKIPWGEEDICRMLELRAISSDVVIDHVRDKMKIPLPTLRTAKVRCAKSHEVTRAYKEMLLTFEANQRRCHMCDRQVMTIDDVIDAGEEQESENQESLYGRQFLQQVTEHHRDSTDVSPKKRHRTGAAKSASKAKKRRGAQVLDWSTSDSDAEMSDLDMWGDRMHQPRASWHPEMLPDMPHVERPPPLGGPFRRGAAQKSWR